MTQIDRTRKEAIERKLKTCDRNRGGWEDREGRRKEGVLRRWSGRDLYEPEGRERKAGRKRIRPFME